MTPKESKHVAGQMIIFITVFFWGGGGRADVNLTR